MTRLTPVLITVTVAFAAGCGRESESGPSLTGRVLIDGKPCRPASLFEFDLKFIGDQGESPIKKSYLAEMQEDGTFTVRGSIGKGIPPRKYRVSISGPVVDAGGKPTRKYMPVFTDKATPLEVEITDTCSELTIDLERKTIEAK